VGPSPPQSSVCPVRPSVRRRDTTPALRLSHAPSPAHRATFIRATRAVTRSPGFGALYSFQSFRIIPFAVSLVQADIVVASYSRRIVSYRIVSFPRPLVSALPVSVPTLSRRSAARVQHTLPLLFLSLFPFLSPPLLRPRVPSRDRDPPWTYNPELALQRSQFVMCNWQAHYRVLVYFKYITLSRIN